MASHGILVNHEIESVWQATGLKGVKCRMINTGNIKNIAAFVLRNKEDIDNILSFFRADDIEKGFICIPQELINSSEGLAPYIMRKASRYVRSFRFNFSGGNIFLDLTLEVKQLGPLSAKYMFTIDDLYFNDSAHRLFFTYQEDVRSNGNAFQALALKALLAKGPLLQTAAEMIKSPLLQISGHSGAMWLDSVAAIEKYASGISLRYISADNGVLKLAFE